MAGRAFLAASRNVLPERRRRVRRVGGRHSTVIMPLAVPAVSGHSPIPAPEQRWRADHH